MPNSGHPHIKKEPAELVLENAEKIDVLREEQRHRDAREELRYDNLLHQPLTLSTAQKVGGMIVALVMAIATISGSWLVFKAGAEYRIAELEKITAKDEAIISQMEQHGFGGHDSRITRLETRSDDQQSKISEIKARLDTLTEIMIRVEKKIDQMGK